MRISITIIIFFFVFAAPSYAQHYLDSIDKAERQEGKLVYWTYGYPNFEAMHSTDKAAAEYEFYYKHVGGCVMNKRALTKIEKHNKRVAGRLSSKIGANWKEMV